jgi:NADH-quinone oxidoreductase subunit C
MSDIQTLAELIQQRFADQISESVIANGELTVELPPQQLREVCLALRDETPFQFTQLIDICGVDYLHYGISQWETEETTLTGFSRAVDTSGDEKIIPWKKSRFAVVYHLLSLLHNQRIRLRVFPEGDPALVESVIEIWASADWYEREAFDLFGILFKGHPDLRRILTDYGFIGHPFRKDFPLIGQVEMRYDATLKRCIYEPVSIQPRTLVPKVIRQDNRYIHPDSAEGSPKNG